MKDMYNEIWQPVVGYEGYAVSNLGRVKSVERTVICKDGRKRHYKEKILKPAKNKGGYLYLNLYKNGKYKSYLVHRLVAEAFIPNPCPEKYDVVNHKDDSYEGRSDNRVENLEWCDVPYNNNYGHHNERIAKANTNHPDLSKTVYQYTTAHELVKEWTSTQEVQRQRGWFNSAISRCCNGKRKTAYGFVWSYTVL